MKTVDTHGTFEKAIAEGRADIQALARGARALIGDVYPEVVEVPWPRQQITGYGLGPKKMSEHFCYIGIHGEHVNLGFYYGADLPDPAGLLQGTGKKMRHIKIGDRQQLEQQEVRELLEAAIQERERVLGRERA